MKDEATEQSPQDKPMTFWAAVSLGIGAMIGAGIFALLGEAGAIAGSAVYLSFILGGVIALLSGYSLGKLEPRTGREAMTAIQQTPSGSQERPALPRWVDWTVGRFK